MPSKYSPKICDGCKQEKDFECIPYKNPWMVSFNYLGGPCPFNPPKVLKANVKTKGQQKQGRIR
jgi:hypothetical protein